jgi:hypothetical protein
LQKHKHDENCINSSFLIANLIPIKFF